MGTPPTTSGMMDSRMIAVVKKQRIQDFLFHKVTMLFAILVLVAMAAILVSLMISAWPAFTPPPGECSGSRMTTSGCAANWKQPLRRIEFGEQPGLGLEPVAAHGAVADVERLRGLGFADKLTVRQNAQRQIEGTKAAHHAATVIDHHGRRQTTIPHFKS